MRYAACQLQLFEQCLTRPRPQLTPCPRTFQSEQPYANQFVRDFCDIFLLLFALANKSRNIPLAGQTECCFYFFYLLLLPRFLLLGVDCLPLNDVCRLSNARVNWNTCYPHHTRTPAPFHSIFTTPPPSLGMSWHANLNVCKSYASRNAYVSGAPFAYKSSTCVKVRPETHCLTLSYTLSVSPSSCSVS